MKYYIGRRNDSSGTIIRDNCPEDGQTNPQNHTLIIEKEKNR